MAATEPRQPDQSLSELFSTLTSDMSHLVRSEVELAKEEVRVEARKAGQAGGALGAAALLGYFTLLLLLFAAAWGLDAVLPTGLAFLVVAVVVGIVAAVLGVMGRNKLREVHPVPEQTIETLKEDAQWMTEQRS
jgi:uncharacterized membrane protein